MPMKTLSILLAFLTIILLLCYQLFSLAGVKVQRDRLQSERLFYRNAVTQVCLNREAVIYAAETQGFRYVEFGEGMEQQLYSSVPNGTTRSVDVHIKPDPFLAPSTGATFHFGQDGCWISGE